ncbi:hypothetical protein LXL04_001894 [Taraxacum kok-saghyz]
MMILRLGLTGIVNHRSRLCNSNWCSSSESVITFGDSWDELDEIDAMLSNVDSALETGVEALQDDSLGTVPKNQHHQICMHQSPRLQKNEGRGIFVQDKSQQPQKRNTAPQNLNANQNHNRRSQHRRQPETAADYEESRDQKTASNGRNTPQQKTDNQEGSTTTQKEPPGETEPAADREKKQRKGGPKLTEAHHHSTCIAPEVPKIPKTTPGAKMSLKLSKKNRERAAANNTTQQQTRTAETTHQGQNSQKTAETKKGCSNTAPKRDRHQNRNQEQKPNNTQRGKPKTR